MITIGFLGCETTKDNVGQNPEANASEDGVRRRENTREQSRRGESLIKLASSFCEEIYR